MNTDNYSDDDIRDILSLKNIAVVGMSKNPEKDAHRIPKYLLDQGYNIIPVNPTADEILGRKCYKSIKDVPGEIDVLNIFRPSEFMPGIVDEAIERGKIKAVWMQLGTGNEQAEKKAEENGIKAVSNRCIMVEHKRLLGNWN